MSVFPLLIGAPLVLVACTTATGGTTQDPNAEPAGAPVACQLSPDALDDRLSEIARLFAGSEERRELEDGYEFRFPGDEAWATRLLALIQSERKCCEFFRFELSFEPQQGPVWIRARGSREVKAFLAAMMEG